VTLSLLGAQESIPGLLKVYKFGLWICMEKIWMTKKSQKVRDKRIDFRAISIDRTRLQNVSLFLELQTKI
jgi:hypothetical protein